MIVSLFLFLLLLAFMGLSLWFAIKVLSLLTRITAAIEKRSGIDAPPSRL